MLADPQTLGLLQSRTRHIRNICILAHVDHGKTTLSDYLLSSNGIISPKLAGKVRFLDSRPDEQERGITMKSTSIALLFNDKRAQQEAALVAALSAGAAAPSASDLTTPATAAAASSNDLYLINLIDSPGHVDFSSEVSNAVRVSDGCLVLVDVLEGICVQTHAVLRQAWNEGVKPVLVLNKIDRLISELQMNALEAYRHIVKILEQVNVITSTFITSDAMEIAAKRKAPASDAAPAADGSDATSTGAAASSTDYEVDIDDEKQWSFSPELGNVVFASAYDCWAFTIPQFSTMLAAKLGGGMKPANLQKVLWGEYYFDAKNKKVLTKPAGKYVTPMFVQMIFENLFALYQTVLIDKDDGRMEKIIHALGLKVLPRELSSSKEPRTKLQLILSKWLPIPAAVLGAVVDHLPDPVAAQGYRMEKFWPGIHIPSPLTDAVRLCSRDYEHVLIYVSKMVDMGDMIRKMRESNAAAATVKAAQAAAGGSAPIVRGAYQKGRFTTPAATDAAAASAVTLADPVAATPAIAPVDSTAVIAATPAEPVPTADDETSRFVAFARIWCGTLRIGPGAPIIKLHVFGPKYDPADPETHAQHSTTITLNDPANPLSSAVALYLLMGTDIQQITAVPAGNVFALGGLSHQILNTATLTSDPSAPPFRNMQYQSAPIVRVAIETEKVGEMGQLVRGLKLLNQADANVQVKLLDSGEHVIVASGELHLERCVRDLKDRFCPGVKLIVSPPLIAFRETIQEDLTIDATKKSSAESASSGGGAGGSAASGASAGLTKRTRAKEERRKDEEQEEKGLEKDRQDKKARKLKEMNAMSDLKPSSSLDDMQAMKSAASEIAPSVGKTGSEVDPSAPNAAAASSAVKPHKLKHVITDSSSNKLVTLTVQALPLPKEVTRALEERVAVVKGLVVRKTEDKKRGKAASAAASSLEASSSSTAESLDEDTKASSSASDITSLLALLRDSFAAPEQKHLFSPEDIDRIWAFGPRSVGPNILINRVEDLTHLTALIPKAAAANASALPSGSQNGSVHGSVQTASSSDRESLFLSISNAILTGFQLACSAGPLCEEPLMGVAFSLEAVEVQAWDEEARGGPDPFGPMSGQTMSLMQKVCRAAFDARARRLMEAVFRVELQISQEALGALHGVLAKRRGAIYNDELREGTTTYLIQAWLPVAESFGFAGDVRKKTGGEASPQLIFSHWEIIQQDPFFVPRSEEELEFHGAADATPNLARDLVDHVRRRKGLAVQQKTVEHAEKQRTIKR